MKPISQLLRNSPVWTLPFLALAVSAVLLVPASARAFPPAPHHLIYGTVRDEYGTPLMTSAAQVILQTPTGVRLKATVAPGVAPGVNYQI